MDRFTTCKLRRSFIIDFIDYCLKLTFSGQYFFISFSPVEPRTAEEIMDAYSTSFVKNEAYTFPSILKGCSFGLTLVELFRCSNSF